jgi:hypothetical protein
MILPYFTPPQTVHADPVMQNNIVAKVMDSKGYERVEEGIPKTEKVEPIEPPKPKPKAHPKVKEEPEEKIHDPRFSLFQLYPDHSDVVEGLRPPAMQDLYDGNFGCLTDEDAIQYHEEGWRSQILANGRFTPDIGGIFKIGSSLVHATNVHYADHRHDSRFANALFFSFFIINALVYEHSPTALRLVSELKDYKLFPLANWDHIRNPLGFKDTLFATFDYREKIASALAEPIKRKKRKKKKKGNKRENSFRDFLERHDFLHASLGASTRINDLDLQPKITILANLKIFGLYGDIVVEFNVDENRRFSDDDLVYRNTFVRR